MPSQQLTMLLLCLSCLIAIGCQPERVVTEFPDERQNLQDIVMAYQQATTDLRRPPANADEFRPFLASYGDPDALSRSPRDGEPYEIAWGVSFTGKPGEAMPIIAREKQGVDGVRLSVDLRLHIREEASD